MQVRTSEPMSARSEQSLITYLRPAKGWIPLNLSALWAYRELVYFLTWRDIKVRYKQAVLGVAWALLHALEHTAIHLGHMQIMRQLWEQRRMDNEQ